MDMDYLKIGIAIANVLLTLALWMFAFNSRKQQATTQSIKDLEANVNDRFEANCLRIAKLESDITTNVNERFEAKCLRIAKLESDVAAIPGKDEIVRVHERLDDLFKIYNENAQTTNLLLGKLSGQIQQMNAGTK